MENPMNSAVFNREDLLEYKDKLEAEVVELWNDETNQDVDDINDIDFDFPGISKDLFDHMDYYKQVAGFCDQVGFYGIDVIIHEDYFEEYVEQLLKDIGILPDDFPSFIEIDWEATADNVRMDYAAIEYKGETYLTRA